MIKNIQKVAERIKLAAQNGERIILYGDSDCDGVTSTVILKEAIKSLGGEVFMVLFPDRENDGYGLNMRALEVLKNASPALLITLDLGIGNVKEIALANQMGFEVIVIDHHESLASLPEASIILDPKQAGDDSGYQYLCNAGLVFKLCEVMLGNDFSLQLQNNFLELVALATISDMVPQVGENVVFIERGLRSMRKTFRPGLKVFFEKFGEGEIVSGGFSKIISLINVAESVDWKNEAYHLLTSRLHQEAMIILENLSAKIFYKQQKIREISEEVFRRVAQKGDQNIIFEGDPSWKLTLAGPVASIVAQKYGKPTFIFKKMESESCGSVRSLGEGENAVDAMKTCQDFLITYGGHAKAAGFRVKNEDLEKFKKNLADFFMKHKS